MREMDNRALLDLAATLAEQAARLILEVRARGFAVTRKEDFSPVTEADRAAEALITTALRAATPEIPVIAEEEVAAGRITVIPGGVGGRFWLVDPLDGTREFAAGEASFTVNIGLVAAGIAILGAVAVPASGEIFGGIVGAGAWKRQNGAQRPITTRAPPPAGLAVLASRHHGDDPALAAALAGKRIAAIHKLGSAVKFCRLAEGGADFYPRLGPTMEWDTAAPQAVLEAAGGAVLDGAGAPLRYGKPGFLNPPFFCYGRPPDAAPA
jgi:3'(2'), 5'-bisphosphate nucleotidase